MHFWEPFSTLIGTHLADAEDAHNPFDPHDPKRQAQMQLNMLDSGLNYNVFRLKRVDWTKLL